MVYRIGPAWTTSLDQLEANLQTARFVECGLTQEKSVGWTPPRGDDNGPLAESVGGQWLLRLMMESKAVPASVINRKMKERIAQTIAFITTIPDSAFADAESRTIMVKAGPRELSFSAAQYYGAYAIPNFYFHMTTAYAILRANGVDVGKGDFLGA